MTRLDRVLKALPKAAEEGVKEAHAQNGNEAVSIIRGDVPVDEGLVRKSVNWSFGDPPKSVYGSPPRTGKRRRAPRNLRISIWAGGKPAPHAHLVHFGTGRRQTEAGADRGVMPAQPFFWPNIRSLRRRMKGRLSRKANKAIRKVAKS